MKKTKADLFSILDNWTGEVSERTGKVSREIFCDWLKNQKDEYYNHIGQKITGGHRMFTEWSMGKTIKGESKFMDKTIQTKREIDPISLDEDFEFPDGESQSKAAYLYPKGNWKILFLNDIHVPYHCIKSVRAAISYAKKKQVNGVILNGDSADFYQLSKFSRNPSKANLREEIELMQDFLKELRRHFPSEKIIFKTGNHENRLHRYIYDKAPELYGIEALSLYELLKLKELNIDYIHSEQNIHIGKLRCIHGHEYGGGGGINVARGMRLKANANVIFGHFHKTQSDFSQNMDGEIHGSWAVGCGLSLQIKTGLPTIQPMEQRSGYC